MRFLNLLIITGLILLNQAFTGPLPVLQEGREKETIKIGLLISENKSPAAKYGAELAVKKANEKGGFRGKYFSLVVRSMEGPWGTGSKEAVSMIFDEDVIAIMGSHDGRNAHLAEQVSAKSRVAFLSAWAGDPTLSQAFVPWFFNCVPNDRQQADALAGEIYARRNLQRVAVISDGDYDSKSALDNFLKVAASLNKPEPVELKSDNKAGSLTGLAERVSKPDIDCIILFVQPPSSLKIAEELRLEHINKPVLGPLFLLDENKIPPGEMKYYNDMLVVSSEDLTAGVGASFGEEYRKTYGSQPGAVAAYAYDGMNILLNAIKKSDSDRDKIKNSLKETKYEGVTGMIQFDDKGNRKSLPGLVKIKNGIPVSVKR